MKNFLINVGTKFGKWFYNNLFYIIGYLIIFGFPLYTILNGAVVEKPAGWSISFGSIIPLVCYLVFFLKWLKGFIHTKLGSWKAVNELDESKHAVGIMLLTLVVYLSYGSCILLGYFIVNLVATLSIGLVNFFRLWAVSFFIGILFLYIDTYRHIYRKGLLQNESKEIIKENKRKVAKQNKKR